MDLSGVTKRLTLWGKKPEVSDRFWELAEQQEKFMYNVALKYTGSRYDAEDLVQETMYLGLINFHQLREEDRFKSWIFTILRNQYFKSLRQSKIKQMSEFDERIEYVGELERVSEQIDIEAAYDKKTEAETLAKLVSRLPEQYKAVMILYFMEEFSYQQIADDLEIPIGTVMSRLSRGKQLLKKALLRELDFEVPRSSGERQVFRVGGEKT